MGVKDFKKDYVMAQDLEKLKYPIGLFHYPEKLDEVQINFWINQLEKFPQELLAVTSNLSIPQLAAQYRPGGWTVRQVIHHVADSHVNAYTRVKLTLTEENPVVRPYDEERWAELPDAKNGEIDLSVAIIEAIHHRLIITLRNLSLKDFERKYTHPALNRSLTLGYLVGNYAWHGQHHLAHITAALSGT
ncbi:YfiT family bacillithiol transferase [Pedobacter insulae]|uniref:DinB superfamily protein n=1 Tax=Pedobacter insulae TaxID=414048 RepID=A0A1I2XCU5_9SPHI|nr:putative metal-dependent hydrolase [Pedobacter insulae]SFH11354.1 DinB superfamily protein [Pedobacter insulae]